MNEENRDGKDYLGRGWAFPPRWRRQPKDDLPVGAVLVRAEEDVRQAILIILRTGLLGDRVMLPEFGAGVDRYV
ncbi:MAG: baseplate protein, partial [Thermoanaerobaculia bacterium]